MRSNPLHVLPPGLPVPQDDGACAHLRALRLPTFVCEGFELVKRLTLIARAGRIEKVFYPVFPPDADAGRVLTWLREHGAALT